MDELIKTLPIVLRAAGQSEEVTEAAAKAAFRHAAGAGLRDHVVPLKLEGRTLLVGVADPIWQSQIASICSQLIFRVNSILHQSAVARIEVVVDPKLIVVKRTEKPEAVDPVEADVSVELWSAAKAIQDPDLRKNFLRAASAALKRRTSDKL